jgi:hypothetical protein
MAYKEFLKIYIRSSAIAKKVTLNGSTMLTHWPMGENNTIKNIATEIRNNIQ